MSEVANYAAVYPDGKIPVTRQQYNRLEGLEARLGDMAVVGYTTVEADGCVKVTFDLAEVGLGLSVEVRENGSTDLLRVYDNVEYFEDDQIVAIAKKLTKVFRDRQVR